MPKITTRRFRWLWHMVTEFSVDGKVFAICKENYFGHDDTSYTDRLGAHPKLYAIKDNCYVRNHSESFVEVPNA